MSLKKRYQRIFSLFLAAVLIASSVPATAVAEAAENGGAEVDVQESLYENLETEGSASAGMSAPETVHAPETVDTPDSEPVGTADGGENYSLYSEEPPQTVTEWPSTDGVTNGNWLIDGDYTFTYNNDYYFRGTDNTITINGDVTLSQAAIIQWYNGCSGNTLIIKGNLTCEGPAASSNYGSGYLSIGGTNNSLVVEGDLIVNNNKIYESVYIYGTNNKVIIQGSVTVEGGSTSAVLLSGTDNTFIVDKDFTINGNTSGTIRFIGSKSTLSISGNLTLNNGTIGIGNSGTSSSYENNNLVVDGDFSLILGGISDYNSNKSASVSVKGNFIQSGGYVTLGYGTTLDIGGNYEQMGGSLTQNYSSDISITGNFLQTGGSITQGHLKSTISIKGDFLQTGGSNALKNGVFAVDGNFSIGTKGEEKDGYILATSSGSTIIGESGALSLTVGGDLTVCTSGALRNYGNANSYSNWNGIIELKGNFYQYGNCSLNNAATYGYAVSDNFACNIRFTGTDRQHIYFDSTDSVFGTMSATNTLLSPDSLIKFYALGSDVTLDVDAAAENNAFPMGEFPIRFSPNLKGYNFTINGSVLHESGCIYYNGGKMIVNGDYTMGSKGVLSGDYIEMTSTGSISQGQGTLEVAGTLTLCTNASSDLNGTVRLGGDLRQYGSYGTTNSTKYAYSGSFRPAKLVFCGDSAQRISIDGAGSYPTLAYFENDNIILESNISTLKLGSDARIQLADIQPQPEITSLLDLNGHALTIDGNYTQTRGTISINKGILTVKGDYSIGTKGDMQGDYRLATSAGILNMRNAEDFVYVEGDFTICSSISSYSGSSSSFTDGFMYVQGDFSQYGNYGYSDKYAAPNNFVASGKHKVILNGDNVQKVHIEGDSSRFCKLELMQPRSNYEFSGNIDLKSIDVTYHDTDNAYIDIINDYVYTGEAIIPEITILHGDDILVEGVDYELTFQNNVNAADRKSDNPPTVNVHYLNGDGKGQASASFTILPRDLSDINITVQAPDMEYSGNPLASEPIVKYWERILEKDKDYSLSYQNNIEIGRASVTVTGQGNFTGTRKAEFLVVMPDALKKPISDVKNTSIPDMSYTGREIEPEVELYDEGVKLIENTDYELSYFDNVKTGRAAVIIQGKGKYKGVSSIPFTIKQRALSDSGVTIEPISSRYFTGKAIKPKVVVRADGIVLTEGIDYTLSYSNNINASGTKNATVTIKGKGGCKGSRKASFVIMPSRVNWASIVVTDAAYNKGKPVKAAVTLMDGDYKLKANKDYTISYSNNTFITDSAVVTITGKGNYAGSVVERNFRIYKSVIKNIKVAPIAAQQYTGSGIAPTVTVASADGTLLRRGYDYTVTYGRNTDAGKGEIYINGIGSYGGTKKITFTIRKKSLTSGITIEPIESREYNGNAYTPALSVYDGYRKLVLNRDYTVKYTNNKNAGDAASSKAPRATITGKGNYSGKLSQTFTIQPASLSKDKNKDLTIKVSSAVYENGKAVKSMVIVADGNTILKEKRDYTLSYANNTNLSDGTGANAPVVTITGKGNYASESVNVNFQICTGNIAAAKVSAVLAQDFTGLQIRPKVTVTMQKAGETLTEGKDYILEYGENRRTGTGYVYVIGTGSYGGIKTIKFKIK